jgi:hypothetical protein
MSGNVFEPVLIRPEGTLIEPGLQVTYSARTHIYYRYIAGDGKEYVLHICVLNDKVQHGDLTLWV